MRIIKPVSYTHLDVYKRQIRMVTIAPELPNALAAIAHFAEAGVVVALGHTDADFEQTRRGIAAGATVATHLFNAMPALLHRAPGPVLALLEDERVTLEPVSYTHLDVYKRQVRSSMRNTCCSLPRVPPKQRPWQR